MKDLNLEHPNFLVLLNLTHRPILSKLSALLTNKPHLIISILSKVKVQKIEVEIVIEPKRAEICRKFSCKLKKFRKRVLS